MDDLVVDGELGALVIEHEDADATAAVVEGVGKAGEKVALVEDGDALLDVTGLGHGDDAAVLADVKDAVLLEDGAQHILDDNRRRGAGDEARLLMELLGKEIHAEVAVLAGLGGGGDADDLAGAALEDEKVTDADVVAGDGDGVVVGRSHGVRRKGGGRGSGVSVGGGGDFALGGRGGDVDLGCGDAGDGRGGGGFLDHDGFAILVVVMVVVVAAAVDGVADTVGCSLETTAEGVILAVVVVISHIKLVLIGGVDGGPGSLLYSDVGGLGLCGKVLGGAAELGALLLVGGGGGAAGELWGGTSVHALLLDEGAGAFAELTFGHVNLGGRVLSGGAV